MAFIHPVILRDGRTADTLSRKKYADIQKRQIAANLLNRGELKQGAERLPNIDDAITHVDIRDQDNIPAMRLPEPVEFNKKGGNSDADKSAFEEFF